MLYNVMLQVDAEDGDAVKNAVGEWVVPGGTLINIMPAYPVPIVDAPHEADPETGKLPPLKRADPPKPFVPAPPFEVEEVPLPPMPDSPVPPDLVGPVPPPPLEEFPPVPDFPPPSKARDV